MALLPQELIRKKRDGHSLTNTEITQFIDSVTSGEFTNAQIASMCMAIFLNGMSRDETVSLTSSMCHSGDVLNWDHIDGPIVDKHSTGGVGDNVSLVLAPLAAACGLYVPMISGRGLGHTGGTLDKLESIPGYNVNPSIEAFDKAIQNVGCAIISASANLAPADKKIYAIRDISGTVESVPLIVASILSKKLASGLDGLVLDVKCGNGATTSNVDEAKHLAQELVDVANGARLRTKAIVTDMNQPLASSIGNALEVQHAIDFLTGRRKDKRFEEVVLSIVSSMLVLGKIAKDLSEAIALAKQKLDDGSAAEKFAQMASQLGGPSDILNNASKLLPAATIKRPILAEQDGWISGYETRELGMAVVRLRGGRTKPDDELDYAVGFSDLLPVGEKVSKGDQIAITHVSDEEDARASTEAFFNATKFSDKAVAQTDVIVSEVTASK